MTRLLRITAVLMSLLTLTFILSSCDVTEGLQMHFTPATEEPRGIPETNDSDYVDLSTDSYTYSRYYTPIHPRHSYTMLSDGQKALYDALLKNVSEVYPDTDEDEDLYKTKQVIVDDYLLSTADIRVAAKALYDDNPDLFWLSSTIYQLTDEEEGYTAVQMRSIYSPEEIDRMQKAIFLEVNAFYQSVPSGLSAYDREKYAHDYINERCEYDKQAAQITDTSKRIEEAYTIYGTLSLHKAVCEGYARSMQLLLCGLGVDCVGITGIGFNDDGEEELHMWNAVCLDDDWYYVDPTWDDQSTDFRRYQYFNLDETTLSQDHHTSRALSELTEDEINGDETYSSVAMNIFLPECSNTYYEYYIYERPHLTDYDGEEVIDALYQAALNKDRYFSFYVDPDELDLEYSLNVMFRESPQYFFDYVREVNEQLVDYEIDNSNLTYYGDDKRSVVTVELNYY